ncbi:MAG: CotH kinase family protein [Bacteroidota bacterium]|nr:CotH kinase family protein [Bacteroidota bacterium]
MKRALLIILISASSFFQLRAADGDSIWANNFIHDIYFTFAQTSYWDTLLANHTADVDTRVDMIFDGQALPSCGIKMKGNSSFNGPSNKKSFKVDLNEFVSGQDYDGIKKFNLNNGFKDPSMLREKLALDFMNAHNVTAPRCNFARVYLNGVYWGLYTIVEEIDSKFLKQHYPDDDGNLFKGDPSGDLKWYGSSESAYYTRYELENNTTQNDWGDLVHLADIINNTPPSSFYDSLETVFDSWAFLNYMAATNMFANLDSYIGSGHNYYIYDDSTYFKFRWIAWDVNESFGNFMMTFNTSTIQTMNYDYVSSSTNRPLATKMLADPTYRAMYLSCLCNLMPYFNNSQMDATIDSLANVIRSSVYSDNLKTYTNQQFEDNINMPVNSTPGLKSFISARSASLTSQLSFTNCWLGVNEQPVFTNAISVYPNPAQTSVTISVSESAGADAVISFSDVTGKELLLIQPDQNHQYVLSTADLPAGIYFLVLNSAGNSPVTSKLVVMH